MYLIWVAGYCVAASRCQDWRAAGGGGDAGHGAPCLDGGMDYGDGYVLGDVLVLRCL